jgi:hypothetical protein
MTGQPADADDRTARSDRFVVLVRPPQSEALMVGAVSAAAVAMAHR